MRHSIFSLMLAVLVLLVGVQIATAKRMALVIGNDDYQEVVKLQKAVNDAQAMADALESVGFEVTRAKNVVRRDMNFQVQRFVSKLRPGDEALFFYAGHGIEIAGRNYLLPTDIPSAKPGGEEFIKAEAVPVDRILRSIRSRGTRVAIMVLDACRDNPFPSEGTRSLGATRGLARMPSAEGTFIMYSAGVGQTALDRLSDTDPHPNSVFTRSLVPLIKTPGFSLTRTARLVRRKVQDLAGKVSHDQRPAYYDEVTGDFFFSAIEEKVTSVQTAPPKPTTATTPKKPENDPSFQIEVLFWTSVKDSSNPAIIETYLKKYPKGQFADLARVKLAELNKSDAKPDTPPPKPAPPKPVQEPKEEVVATVTPPTQPTPTTTPPKRSIERVTLTPTVWPVGKWPEGITYDGQSLWIAESGVRQVAQMHPGTGRIIKRVKVGRLPVNMVTSPAGKVFSLVHTDGLVWAHSSGGQGRRLAKLRDFPENMAADDRHLWVLTHPGGSSANTKVVRIDHRTGKSISSADLPDPNAFGIAHSRGRIWLVHGQGRGSRLSALDANTLARGGSLDVDVFLNKIVSTNQGVFVAGGQINVSGTVIKYNPDNGQEVTRVQLPKEFVGTLGAFGKHVIAIGDAGTIWVLSARDLSITRVIKLNFEQYSARGIYASASTLFLTTQIGQGENGSVLAVRNWQPGRTQDQQVATLTPATPPTLPPAPAAPERVNLPASVWPIGKWPEGITSDGQNLWIAESGVRHVAQMNASTGQIMQRIKVGRLPVDMVASPAGRVFSLIYTDGLVWSHPARGKGKRLAKLSDYPQDMVANDRYLYILTHPGGSSANTKVVRVDQRTGQIKGSGPVPDSSSAGIALVNGKVWIVHGNGRSGKISVLEPDSLKLRAVWNVSAFVRSIAANEHGAFAAGGEWNKSGVVIRFDPTTGLEKAQANLPGQFVAKIGVFQDRVIAIGNGGIIWVLSAHDLRIQRVISTSFGTFQPQDVHATSSTLYVTTHRGRGVNGSVLAVRNWQPAGDQQPEQKPEPSLSLGNWKFDGRTSAEESEGRGVLYSASVDVSSPGGQASFILSCFPSDKKIGLSMMGREKFERLAQSAIQAGKGRFSSQDSYIDLVIDGQPYPLKANFFEMNGALDLDSGYRANGRIMGGLLRSSVATLNAASNAISIPLRNSTSAICQALGQCGIRQAHCQAKGH